MKKNSLMKIIGITVPVLIAAFGELSDVLEERKNEERMEQIENRLSQLERNDPE